MLSTTVSRSVLIFEGILFIIFGLLAIALPGIFTLGLELTIGCLFIIAGIVQLVRTFTTKGTLGTMTALLSAVLYIVIGILLLSFPFRGVLALTILLTVYFVIEGIAKIVLAFQLKQFTGWLWLFLSGILSLALALIIWYGWPNTAFWVLGLLVGINLLFFGFSLLAVSFASNMDD